MAPPTTRTRTRKSTSAAEPAAPRRAAGTGSAVRIRMYNVGFGDCFLLFVPTEAGERKILIDCGSIKTAKHGIGEIVGALLDDLKGSDGRPHVDLLIATHRHRDHISGFADPRWREVSVGEVWMPWTESPSDARATRLRQMQMRFAVALENAIKTREMAGRAALLDLVANAQSNEAALDMLRQGFRGRPPRHYLPGEQEPGAIRYVTALPGIEFHLLGPPHDEAALERMKPAANEAYLAALEFDAAGAVGDQATFDFGWNWVIMGDFARAYLDKRHCLSREDMAAVNAHARERDWELLAASADNAINNTSLILMIRVGAAHLLFPGDAQWGPWQLLLDNAEASGMLAKTTFYKVGHHGSHNATPKRFVEMWAKSGRKRTARQSMMSVTSYQRYKDIPRQPLVDALVRTVGQLVRSDEIDVAHDVKRSGELWVEMAVPTG